MARLAWGQIEANVSAVTTVLLTAGACGACQRKFPVGGAA